MHLPTRKTKLPATQAKLEPENFISVNSKGSAAYESIYLDKNTIRVWLPELKTMADVAGVMS